MENADPVEIMKKRTNVDMFSFVVYNFSSCIDDALKLLELFSDVLVHVLVHNPSVLVLGP